MSTVVNLSWLIKAQQISETLATPHRLFDEHSVREDVSEEDPLVAMQLVFIECANTGVRSPLERYHCVLLDETGKSTSVVFAVDLIEGLMGLAPTMNVLELVKADVEDAGENADDHFEKTVTRSGNTRSKGENT